MHAEIIIEEIKKLPLEEKFHVVEETIKSIKKEEAEHHLSIAAEEMYNDYANDKELVVFTQLDLENFYEAR